MKTLHVGLLCLSLLTGCLRVVVDSPVARSGKGDSASGVSFVGLTTVTADAGQCTYGIAKVETYMPAWGWFLGAFTAGLVPGMEAQYHCAAQPTFPDRAALLAAQQKAEEARQVAEAAQRKAEEELAEMRRVEADRSAQAASLEEQRRAGVPDVGDAAPPAPPVVAPVAATAVAAGYRSSEGYQKSKWGMSREEVTALFPSVRPVKTHLGMQTETAGRQSVTIFMFTDIGLAAVIVTFPADRLSGGEYLRDFEELKGTLVSKYGTPSSEGVDWRDNTLFGNDPKRLSTAVLMGHAVPEAKWNLTDSVIHLTCKGGGMKAENTVAYVSRALGVALTEQETRAKAADL